MRITRLLLLGFLALAQTDSANAQSTYNSHADRSAREVYKNDQEREQRSMKKFLQKAENEKRETEEYRNGNAGPVETPEEKAKREEKARIFQRREAEEWEKRKVADAKKAEEKKRADEVKAANEKRIVEKVAEIETRAWGAVTRGDAKELFEINKIHFEANGIWNWGKVDTWQRIFETRMASSTKDDVTYFGNLRTAKELWHFNSPTYGYMDICLNSYGIDHEDFVKLRLMILEGNYEAAIESLKKPKECFWNLNGVSIPARQIYGERSLKFKSWKKLREDKPENELMSCYLKSKEMYEFTNYMAGQCFQVLNMPDSAARYLKLGGDFSVEWNRLAAYQNSVGWSPKRPMLSTYKQKH